MKELSKVMVYNLRSNITEIITAIAAQTKKTSNDSPLTYGLFLKYIVAHPLDSSKALVCMDTIRDWYHEIKEATKKAQLNK
jgi:hypothetical protein